MDADAEPGPLADGPYFEPTEEGKEEVDASAAENRAEGSGGAILRVLNRINNTTYAIQPTTPLAASPVFAGGAVSSASSSSGASRCQAAQ
jgi:hypothetical protein